MIRRLLKQAQAVITVSLTCSAELLIVAHDIESPSRGTDKVLLRNILSIVRSLERK